MWEQESSICRAGTLIMYINQLCTSIRIDQKKRDNLDAQKKIIAAAIFRWCKKRFNLMHLKPFLQWLNASAPRHKRLLLYARMLESKWGKPFDHDIHSLFRNYFDWDIQLWGEDGLLTPMQLEVAENPMLLLQDRYYTRFKYSGITDFLWPLLSLNTMYRTQDDFYDAHSARMIYEHSVKEPNDFMETMTSWKDMSFQVPFTLLFSLGCSMKDYYHACHNPESIKPLIEDALHALSSLDTRRDYQSMIVSQNFDEFGLVFDWDIPIVWTSWLRDIQDPSSTTVLLTHLQGALVEAYAQKMSPMIDVYYNGQSWRPSEMLHFLKTGVPPESILEKKEEIGIYIL